MVFSFLGWGCWAEPFAQSRRRLRQHQPMARTCKLEHHDGLRARRLGPQTPGSAAGVPGRVGLAKGWQSGARRRQLGGLASPALTVMWSLQLPLALWRQMPAPHIHNPWNAPHHPRHRNNRYSKCKASRSVVEWAYIQVCQNGATTSGSALINPGMDIPWQACKVHGINNADLRDEPRLDTHAATLLDLLPQILPERYSPEV